MKLARFERLACPGFGAVVASSIVDLGTAEVRKFVRDEIVKWHQVAIDAKMPREGN